MDNPRGLLVAFTGFCLMSLVWGDECPVDAVVRTHKCMSTFITVNSTRSIGAPFFDVKDVSSYCEDGSLQNMVTCMEDLVRECEGSQVMETLSLMVDIKQMKKGVTALCKKSALMEASAVCLTDQSHKMSTCAQAETSRLRSALAEAKGNTTAMLITQCKFLTIMVECQRTVVTIACGREIADTYADFMLAFVPHSCDKKREALAGPSNGDHDVIETKISSDNSARSQSTLTPLDDKDVPTDACINTQPKFILLAFCSLLLVIVLKL